MKRILALVLTMAMLLTIVSGCGAPETDPQASLQTDTSAGTSQEPVTIKWMHHFAEEARNEWVQEVADKTHELYPYITVEVEVQPFDKYLATLKTKIQSDDAPDLFDVTTRATLEEFVEAGHCADLTQEEFLNTLMDTGIDSGRFGDKVYAVTQDMGGAAVFYNKQIFADHNLSVPTTYSEWTAILETLSKTEIAPIAAGYQEVWALLVDTWADFVPVLFRDDKNWAIDKMSGTTKFEGDAKFADVMGKIYDRSKYTQRDPFGTDWNKACELVATGKAATVIGGFFALDAILSKNPDIELGAFALPTTENPKDSMAPLGQPGGFIVYEGSKNKDATTKLLSVMLSKEMAAKYQTVAKTISVVKDLPTEDMLPALKDIVAIEADGRVISTSSLASSFTGEYQKAYTTQLVKFLMADSADVVGFAKVMDEEFAKVAK